MIQYLILYEDIQNIYNPIFIMYINITNDIMNMNYDDKFIDYYYMCVLYDVMKLTILVSMYLMGINIINADISNIIRLY